MNKKQLYVLSAFFTLLGVLFVRMSLLWKQSCDIFGEVDMANIFACIKGEVFSPFPYIFFGLGFVLIVVAWLEKK